MVLCGLGMQQYAMHNAPIQKTTFLWIRCKQEIQKGFTQKLGDKI